MGKKQKLEALREDVINDLSASDLDYVLTIYSPPSGWEVKWIGPANEDIESLLATRFRACGCGCQEGVISLEEAEKEGVAEGLKSFLD